MLAINRTFQDTFNQSITFPKNNSDNELESLIHAFNTGEAFLLMVMPTTLSEADNYVLDYLLEDFDYQFNKKSILRNYKQDNLKCFYFFTCEDYIYQIKMDFHNYFGANLTQAIADRKSMGLLDPTPITVLKLKLKTEQAVVAMSGMKLFKINILFVRNNKSLFFGSSCGCIAGCGYVENDAYHQWYFHYFFNQFKSILSNPQKVLIKTMYPEIVATDADWL